jgi:hypothetical protein
LSKEISYNDLFLLFLFAFATAQNSLRRFLMAKVQMENYFVIMKDSVYSTAPVTAKSSAAKKPGLYTRFFLALTVSIEILEIRHPLNGAFGDL